jgi:hypothetical protein
MDTSVSCSIIFHRTDGSLMPFVEHSSGLYIFDPLARTTSAPVPPILSPAVTILSTVSSNKQSYSAREIASADTARSVYRLIGRPSERNFQHILRHNLLRNCPVTPIDATRALRIYGPDVAFLKGTTRK